MPSSQDYFLARIPDFQTVLPSYPIATAVTAAIALYWDRFVPESSGLWIDGPIPNTKVAPTIDEALLTERQKSLIGLRAALGAVPVVTQGFTVAKLENAQAGPAEAKFQDLSRLIKALLPQWQTELKNLEAFEGIFFDLLPNVPAYLQTLSEVSCFDSSVGYVVETGSWFVNLEGGQF